MRLWLCSGRANYSFHEPEVCCIYKGKEQKKYEFGSKASIAMIKADCIIVAAKIFRTEYDGGILLAIAAFNFRKWMRTVVLKVFVVLCSLLATGVPQEDLQRESA